MSDHAQDSNNVSAEEGVDVSIVVPKKKSRWGDSVVDAPTETSVVEQESKKVRKSRWAPQPVEENTVNGDLSNQMNAMKESLILKMKLQHLQERIANVFVDAARIEQDPNRSPSPPPRYDTNGKRTNTREVRMRESLMKERLRVIEDLVKTDVFFVPPADFVKTKPFRKVFIPESENTDYNYVGLIIGPRGNTQKRMEAETGCKISIRGKGSVKPGANGRAHKIAQDEDDPLHAHVQGEDPVKVEMAAKMIEELLKTNEFDLLEHKQKQLRELVSI